MYPPKVRDTDIRQLIRELTAGGRLPTGVELRAALTDRFGSRGGVSRIYRLLAEERTKQGAETPSNAVARLMRVEVENLRHLLAAASHTADKHQAYWLGKVSELQAQIDNLEQRYGQAAEAAGIDPHHADITAVSVKTGQLQVLVRAFGPASMKAKLEGLLQGVESQVGRHE